MWLQAFLSSRHYHREEEAMGDVTLKIKNLKISREHTILFKVLLAVLIQVSSCYVGNFCVSISMYYSFYCPTKIGLFLLHLKDRGITYSSPSYELTKLNMLS